VVTQNARRSGTKPLLKSLHWLPMRQHVTYKLATVCFKARSTSTPAYLQSLLVPHVPSWPLRSSHTLRLAVPRTRTVFASRAFSVAAPTVCNSLPDIVVNWDTLATYKQRLKTYLFTASCETLLPPKHLCISYYDTSQVFIIHSFIQLNLQPQLQKTNTLNTCFYRFLARWYYWAIRWLVCHKCLADFLERL